MKEPGPDWVKIRVNGHDRRVPPDANVAGLLAELDLDPTGVVVEVNGDILQRDRYAETILTATAQVEIIHFVGGG